MRTDSINTWRSLWFLHEIEPGTAAHRIAAALRLRGELDKPALRYTLELFVARHASPYPVFPPNGRGLVQRPTGEARKWIRESDAPDLDDAQLTEWIEYEAREPFNLDCGPPLRICMYHRATAVETVVLVVAHHLIADFWSMTTLVRELEMLYFKQLALPERTDFVRNYSWVNGSRVSAHAALSPDSVVCSGCQKAQRYGQAS